MSPKITIILPFYNTGDYIKETLSDVINQTYSDFECLCIDKASTDNTYDVCKEVVSGDSRFKMLREYEPGVPNARNMGLDIAKGEYVYFCDSDDRLHPRLLEICMKAMGDADVLQFDYVRFVDGESVEFPSIGENLETSRIENALSWFVANNPGCALWRKFFRRDVIGRHRLKSNLRRMDDRFLVYELLNEKPDMKWSLLGVPLYYYRKRPESIVTSKFGDADLAQYDWLMRAQTEMFSAHPNILNVLRCGQFVFMVKIIYRELKNATEDVRSCGRKVFYRLMQDGIIRYRDFSIKWALRVFLFVRRG